MNRHSFPKKSAAFPGFFYRVAICAWGLFGFSTLAQQSDASCIATGDGFIEVKTSFSSYFTVANADCSESAYYEIDSFAITPLSPPFDAVTPGPVIWDGSNDPKIHTANPLTTYAPSDQDGNNLKDAPYSFATHSLKDVGVYNYWFTGQYGGMEAVSQNADGSYNNAYRTHPMQSEALYFYVDNYYPDASINPGNHFHVGESVNLDSHGNDPDGGNLAYIQWTVDVRPQNSVANVSDAKSLSPQLVIGNKNDIGHWKLNLRLADNEGEQRDFPVEFDVDNRPPSLTISGEISVNAGQTLHLEASPSVDPDGETVSFVWEITPKSGQASYPSQSGPVFDLATKPADIGTFEIKCTATDEHPGDPNSTAEQTLTITVKSIPPTISIADKVKTIRYGDTIHFETTQLNDGYGDPMTSFQWDILQVPIAAGLGLVPNYMAGPSITIAPPLAAPGTYIFKLTATDQVGDTAVETCKVLVDADPVAKINGPDQIGSLTLPLNLDGSGSTDPDSPGGPNQGHLASGVPDVSPGITAFKWSIAEVPADAPSIRYHRGPVSDIFHVDDFGAELCIPAGKLFVGDWLFQLEVVDGEGHHDTVDHWVTVLDEGMPPLAIVSPPAYYLTDANGLLSTDVGFDGSASVDLDNLITDPYSPGLGITDYQWNLYTTPAGCGFTPNWPGGATANKVLLYSLGSTVPGICQGVYNAALTVTDDDDSPKKATAYATAMIGNCANDLCIDNPTTASAKKVTVRDKVDVMITYHLNSALYNEATFFKGLRLQLEIYPGKNSAAPIFNQTWDVDLLPSDKGGPLNIHWSGFTNAKLRPEPGMYSTAIRLLDGNGAASGIDATQLNNIQIRVLKIEISSGTDTTVNCHRLADGTDSLLVKYKVTDQTPDSPPFDELRYRIYDQSDGPMVFQGQLFAPFTDSFSWDGDLGARHYLEPGRYELELEIYDSEGSLGKSARRTFTAVQLTLKALGTDPAVALSTGVFIPGSLAPITVDDINFGFLKYQMQPISVEVEPDLGKLEVKLDFESGGPAQLELYRNDAVMTPVALPAQWDASDFKAHRLKVPLLVYGKEWGKAVLKLTYSRGSDIVGEERLKFRVGSFPGVVGLSVPGQFPYFRVMRTNNVGNPVQTALDPGRHAERVGKKAAVYVVNHKSETEWVKDPTLSDVLGGPKLTTLQPGSLADNVVTAGTPATAGTYDVVYDFGALDSTAPFSPDGRLDPGDILDSPAGNASFTVEPDLSLLGPLTFRTTDYGMVNPSTITIPIGFDSYTGAAPFRLRGQLVYPAGLTAKAPLVVFAHGNHTPWKNTSGVKVSAAVTTDENFHGHTYLQKLLASTGCVTLSVDLDEMSGLTSMGYPLTRAPGVFLRAWVMLKNIEKLLTDSTLAGGDLFGKVDSDKIYLVGHSRGGEAVLVAYHLLKNPSAFPSGETLTPGLSAAGIKGIISLSPITKAIDSGISITPPDVPYFLIYGSADGDVNGAEPGAEPFEHYDRATGDKFALRLIGANHNYFNTSWAYSDATQYLAGADVYTATAPNLPTPVGANLISAPAERSVAVGYIRAFLNYYDKYDEASLAYLLEPPAQLRPLGVDPTVPLHAQASLARNVSKFVVDNYEVVPSTAQSSSGQLVSGTVSHATDTFLNDANIADESEVWNRFFQDTNGGLFDWKNTPAEYVETLEPAHQDLRGTSVLSFRVAQQPKHANTTAQAGTRNFAVELEDVTGQTSAVNVALLDPVPGIYEATLTPDLNNLSQHRETTSAAFKTFRVPVAAFVSGGRQLDLEHISKIRFKFGAPGSPVGRIAVDDIEVEQ